MSKNMTTTHKYRNPLTPYFGCHRFGSRDACDLHPRAAGSRVAVLLAAALVLGFLCGPAGAEDDVATPPTLRLLQPSANAVLGDSLVTVSGTYERASGTELASVSCNGKAGVVFGERFTIEDIPIKEGANRLTVVAKDAAGRVAESAIELACDLTAPRIRVSEPAQGALLSVFRTRVSGTIIDATATSVRVNGQVAAVSDGRFEADVTLREGANAIHIEAADAAGHTSEVTVDLMVDATPPRIIVEEPRSGALVRKSALTVAGRVEDASAAALTVNGRPVPVDAQGRFSLTQQLMAQGKSTLALAARDKAGHVCETSVDVIFDSKPPLLVAMDPVAGNSTIPLEWPITLRFSEPISPPSLRTASVTLESGKPAPGTFKVQGDSVIFTPTSRLPDGAEIRLHASGLRDLAGNELPTPVDARFRTVDNTPPRELVLDPVPPTTSRKSVTITGRTEPDARVYVGVRAAVADKSGRFSIPVPLTPGGRNHFSVSAADPSGNRTHRIEGDTQQQTGPIAVADAAYAGNLVTVTFSRDVDAATVTAQSVTVRTSGGPATGQLSTAGAQVTFTPAPDLTGVAFLLEITTAVTDLGGNALAYPYSRMFNRPAGGMTVLGEVYDDSTGLPLSGALVTAATINGSAAPSPAPTASTGSDGRFALSLDGTSCTLSITKQSYTSASRSVVSLSQLAETILDVRLTPRRAEGDDVIKPEGGVVAVGSGGGKYTLKLDVPPYSVPVEKKINLTVLSGQSLPERLPKGWSPVLAIDLSPAELSFAQAVELTAPVALVAAPFRALATPATLALVRWDEPTRTWRVLGTAAWTPSQVSLAASITAGGQYAWVVADTVPAAPPAAEARQPLTGLPESSVIPSDAVAGLTFAPGHVFPGGTATGRLLLSPVRVVSSGVPVQGRINESYQMLDNQTVSYPLYVADLLVYNYGGGQSMLDFNLSPNRQITIENLREGTMNTSMLRYSSSVMGSVIGAAGGTVSGEGGAEVEIPANALSAATVVTVKVLAPSQLPSTAPEGFRLIGGVELSLGGAVLSAPASLSMPLPTGVTLVDGMLLVTARQAQLETGLASILTDSVALANGRLKTPGTVPSGFELAGVRESGTYLFLEALQPMGYTTGVVTDQDMPVASARVRADGQGLTALAAASGSYAQVALTGTTHIRATHPVTGDQGAAEGSVFAGALLTGVDIALQPTGPSVVGQTPSNGATNVPLASRIQIIFSEPVSPATLTPQTFYVLDGTVALAGTVSLSLDGLLAEFKSAQDLPSSKTLTVVVKGTITDLRGNPMGTDYTSSFTTRDIIAPTYDPAKIRVVLPTDGVICVIGQPGAVEPGATMWLFNERTGASVSTQGLSDGSFNFTITAQAGDKVRIRVIDLASNEIEINPDVYTTPDGRGVELDNGAHSYITPDGLGIRTEAGTFAEPVIVRLDPITDPSQLLPNPDGLVRLSALTLDMEGHRASKPLKLSMPAPADLPADSQMFIAREVFVLGQRKMMVMDTCSVHDGRIEVNSPPWPGVSEEDAIYFMRNDGQLLAFASGSCQGSWAIVSAGDLVYVVDPGTSGQFIVPVRAGNTITLVIRDANTGDIIFSQEIQNLTPNQQYVFTAPVTTDHRRPQLLQATPASVLNVGWFGAKLVTSKMQFAPSGAGVRITGQAGATGGRVNVFRYTVDPDTQAERIESAQTEADVEGGFGIDVAARVGDQLLVAAESNEVDVEPVFVLEFDEPVQPTDALKDVARIRDRDTGALIPCVVDPPSSWSSLTVRAELRLQEQRKYQLEILRIKDLSGNSYSAAEPLAIPFTTRKSVSLEVEKTGRVSGMVLYGKYILAACNDQGLQVLDASDPGDLTPVSSYTGIGEVRSVALYRHYVSEQQYNDYAVIVGGGTAHPGYIKVFNIDNLPNLVEVSSQMISYSISGGNPGFGAGAAIHVPTGKPSRVKVAGDYAFVAIYGAGLLIVDLTQMDAQTDRYRDCAVGWYKEDWISELEILTDGPATRVLLLVDYFGVKMLNVTNTAGIVQEGSCDEMKRAAGGKHYNGLAVALNYAYLDYQGMPAVGDFAFVTAPGVNNEVLIVDITSRTGVFRLVGGVRLPGGAAIGAIAFSPAQRMLYVLDAELGLLRISMANPLAFTPENAVDPRILGTIPTAGRPRYGLVLDEKLNMAYAGDLEEGLVPVRLGPPELMIALKDANGVYGPMPWVLPYGIEDSDYPAERDIYVLVYLPMKAAQATVHAGLRSLLLGTEGATLWSCEEGYVPAAIDPSKVTLRPARNPSNSDPRALDAAYQLFVSDPIRLTIDPKEKTEEGRLKLLAGDTVEAYLVPILDAEGESLFHVSATGASYLSEAEAKTVITRVPTIRAEWLDSDKPEPGQNAAMGLTASIPGVYEDGTCGVFLHSGEQFMEETDLVVPGRGLDFALVRRYESQAIYSGPLGWGWDYNYHRRLQELPNGDVVYFDGLGRREVFVADETERTGYRSPRGVFAELMKRGDGAWVLLFRGLYSETYDQFGRLASMEDRFGNYLDFYYDTAGRLYTVMDTMGRVYSFEYYDYDGTAQSGRLKSVSDF
ncbi:MAG: Ig-like domain-containing protein, partial [Acidobacteriota bacterium]